MTRPLVNIDDTIKRITREWMVCDHAGHVELTPETFGMARSFAMERWREREIERRRPAPNDLSDSCKFCSLFVKGVFGGGMRGNDRHQYNLIDGRVVDLTAGSEQTSELPNPYVHDSEFFGNPEEHIDAMQSCAIRVRQWVVPFLAMMEITRPRMAP